MQDVSIAIPKRAGAGNHAEPPDENAETAFECVRNILYIFNKIHLTQQSHE